MILSSATLKQANQGFNVLFSKGAAAAVPIYPKIAMVVPSSGSQVVYPMWNQLPGMREWVGPRKAQNLVPSNYTIINKDFEETIAVQRNDFDDDNLGIYAPLIQGMGSQAMMHRDILVYNQLAGAFSTGVYKCFDGKAMCASNHTLGTRTFSNVGSAVLSASAFGTALAALFSAFDDKSNFYSIPTKFYLCVAPSNIGTAWEICKGGIVAQVFGSNTAAAGKDNAWQGVAEPVTIPLLELHPTYWFVIAEYAGLKPIILQVRKEPEFIALNNPDDPNVFYNKEYTYGVDDRKNVGWGPFTLIYGSTGGA